MMHCWWLTGTEVFLTVNKNWGIADVNVDDAL